MVLLATGILLGQPDVTRIGVLLIALVAMALFLVRRHGLELEVVRTAVPARIAIDERAVVTVRVRNGESGFRRSAKRTTFVGLTAARATPDC